VSKSNLINIIPYAASGGNISHNSLRVGDWVEVRSKDEILKTLDKNGQLEGLPFMPGMFAFCGKRLRVYKRAHKTCDTVYEYKGRRMKDAVHLEGVRCDGQSHGGCEASCLIFWKTAWLQALDPAGRDLSATEWEAGEDTKGLIGLCTEADVVAGTRKAVTGGGTDDDQPVYVCQATQLPAATEPLAWWEPTQYIEDYVSGNVGLGRIAKSFAYRAFRRNLVNLGIGIGRPLQWFYNVFQRLRGGTPYPSVAGKLPAGARTPTERLNLRPGEWVRVKKLDAILATCEKSKTTNRGMTFDPEMVPHCGGTYRVLRRVARIVNEQTGKMQKLKNPCITLDGVVCQARYSQCRLFCPRSIYPYWREIWLERVEPNGSGRTDGVIPLIEDGMRQRPTTDARD
jgi:hypothetical protein